MQLADLSNPSFPSPTVSVRKQFVRQEIEFRERSESEISPWWKIVTVSTYFLIVAGGIITSITMGTLLAAFQDKCLFYARFTLRGLDQIVASGGNLTLTSENIVDAQYNSASNSDCRFCEYWSAASTVFAGIWGIMFLQCGRGGVTGRSLTASWVIVPPALLTDLVFFIVSCIVFAKTLGGLSSFCNNLRVETDNGAVGNVTTCKQILAFNFPDDMYNTDLYLNYMLAQFGSCITFFGWMIVLFILIVRCFIPVDFVVYGRRLYEVRNFNGEGDAEQSRQHFASTRSFAIEKESPSTSESCEVLPTPPNGHGHTEYSGSVATTSFTYPTPASSKKEQSNNLKKIV